MWNIKFWCKCNKNLIEKSFFLESHVCQLDALCTEKNGGNGYFSGDQNKLMHKNKLVHSNMIYLTVLLITKFNYL